MKDFSTYRKTMAVAYGEVPNILESTLMGVLSDKQIANLKNTWAMKTMKDVTPGVKSILKKMDMPTKVAIAAAKVNILKDIVFKEESDEEVIKFMEAIDEQADIEEGRIKDIFTANQEGDSIEKIAKRLKLSVKTVRDILGEEVLEDILYEVADSITPMMLKVLKKEYEPFRGRKITAARAKQLMNILDKFNDKNLEILKKHNIPFVSSGAMSKLMVRKMKWKTTSVNPFKEEDDQINWAGKLDEANIVFRAKATDGGYFLVLKRDTSGMSGSQDKFLMRHLKNGKVKELGSHPSLDGAKTFGKNRGIIEEVELEEKKKVKELDLHLKTLSKNDQKLPEPEGKKIATEETLVEYTDKQIKMAFGILNDPRYKGGNYSGAYKAIEKLAKGLANHPSVAKALKRANESIEEIWGARKASGGYHGDKTFKKLKSEVEPKGKDLEEKDGANTTSTKGSVWKKAMKAAMKRNYMRKAEHEPKGKELEEGKSDFRISYSDKYGKHAGFEDGETLQDIQNKAQKLRAKGFKIDKMGRNTSPIKERLWLKHKRGDKN